MKLKKFIAPTTREALTQLRAELGEDAIILSTKQTASGAEVLAASNLEMDAIASVANQGTPEPKRQPAGRPPVSWTQADKERSERQRKQAAKAQQSVNEQVKQALRDQTSGAKRRPSGFQSVASAYGVPTPQGTNADTHAAAAGPIAARPRLQSPQAQQVAAEAPNRAQAGQATLPANTQTSKSQKVAQKPAPIKPGAKTPKPDSRQVEEDMLSDLAKNRAQAAGEAMVMQHQDLMDEIREMRQIMKDQYSLITWRSALENNPLRGQIWTALNSAGFSPLFARTVAERLPEDMTEERVQDWLSEVLKRNLQVAEPQDDIVDKGGVYALVGPTGVGKTTTCAKLAARCVVKYGANSLGLVTTDSYRIGAQDQLRIYGKILGVQVYTAQNEADLGQLRDSLSRKRLLLIDTVGMGQRDKRVPEQTKMLVDSHVKRLLLLNASSQPENLDDVVRRYLNRGLEGAILTKLDEAIKLGGALDVAMRHKLKMVYMATGQRVPEDLFMADPRILVHRSLRPLQSNTFSPSSEELKWKMAQKSTTVSI